MSTSRLLILLTGILLLHRTADSQAQLLGGTSSAGGSAITSGTMILNGSISQAVAGTTSGTTYRHVAGFWNPSYGFITGITREEGGQPKVFALQQNYPNPFNPSTIIRFELPRGSDVILLVYDILGREVSRLVNERRNAGVYDVTFDGSNLSSGVYFYRLQAGNFVQTRKLVLLR